VEVVGLLFEEPDGRDEDRLPWLKRTGEQEWRRALSAG
jgi:hypothetical protein